VAARPRCPFRVTAASRQNGGPKELGRIIPAIRFEKSQSLRLRQQSLCRARAGGGQVVLGYVGEEVVDCTSLPLPQILAENPRWKKKWMKAANELSALLLHCAGVISGIVNKDDSPMFLSIAPDIFDTSNESEALRHDLLFVLGKYMKNDPEVSMLMFGSNNRMYLMDAQAFIYEHDRVMRGDENLKGAWNNIEGFTSKYELSEEGDGCSKDAVDIDMSAFLPELGSGKMGFLKFSHCATEIEVAFHNQPSNYDPRPALEVTHAQTPATFRGHALGEAGRVSFALKQGRAKSK
jgi:hypothetical protein